MGLPSPPPRRNASTTVFNFSGGREIVINPSAQLPNHSAVLAVTAAPIIGGGDAGRV